MFYFLSVNGLKLFNFWIKYRKVFTEFIDSVDSAYKNNLLGGIVANCENKLISNLL